MTVCIMLRESWLSTTRLEHGPKESVAIASAKPVGDWKGKSIIGLLWRVVKAKVVHAREHETTCFLL